MGSKRVVPIFHAYQLKVIFSHFIHMLFISKEWEWHYSLFPLCPLGNRYFIKVEEILKGSLDSIPSPSRSREHLKFLLWFFGGQTLLGVVNKLFVQQRPAMFGPKKIITKISNVHDFSKMMGLNPGYLLKSLLLW